MMAPDQVFGLASSGHMNAQRINEAAVALSDGLNELYLHPATRDDFDGHGPAYAHCEELAGLIDPSVREALAGKGVHLGNFADFTVDRTGVRH